MNSKLELSHLDKVFFPKAGYTKSDLIDYYRSVSHYILPYLKDRPHSLLRQPDGINGESFFQKNLPEHPSWIKTVKLKSDSTKEDVNYVVCDSEDSLLYMVQLGCIEINPWSSQVGHLDKPDWLVIDLDPEKIDFKYVIETAKAVKAVLDDLKIKGYPKTSGKTGLHVYIPLGAKYSYDRTKQLAQQLAELVNERTPDHTSILRLPEKRQGKVYIDFLQNTEGQTVAAPYCVRPTPEASVSTPLHWDEVKAGLDPRKFTIKNTAQRLKRTGDLWHPILSSGINLTTVLSRIK